MPAAKKPRARQPSHLVLEAVSVDRWASEADSGSPSGWSGGSSWSLSSQPTPAAYTARMMKELLPDSELYHSRYAMSVSAAFVR